MLNILLPFLLALTPDPIDRAPIMIEGHPYLRTTYLDGSVRVSPLPAACSSCQPGYSTSTQGTYPWGEFSAGFFSTTGVCSYVNPNGDCLEDQNQPRCHAQLGITVEMYQGYYGVWVHPSRSSWPPVMPGTYLEGLQVTGCGQLDDRFVLEILDVATNTHQAYVTAEVFCDVCQ